MTLDDLIERVRSGDPVKYLFFWGHTPKTPGAIDRSCLSQWYPAPFDVDGVRYPTAEHFMMAGKARLFGDRHTTARILECEHPDEVKKLGREVRGFDQARWEAHRVDIVVQGNEAKFGQDEALRTFLLGTGDRVLVEASPRDTIWGIGLSANDERATDPARWRGLNLLGFALMEVRSRLRDG